MSAINSKSITGITSITTPPGVDNIFTVHSSDTTERFRVDQSGNQNLSGIITASNFKTGVSNLHNLGLTLSSGQLDVGSNIKLGNAGVITATSYRGDGSQLTGVGIDTSQLDVNKLDVSGISTFKNTMNLISPTGDNPTIRAIDGNDKLTLRSNGLLFYNQNGWKGLESTGSSIKLYNGQMASHTLVFETTYTGVKVGTGVTLETNGQASFSGIVTATSFSGDGSSLSNLPAGAPVGGASTNTVFFENDKEVAVNYQITSTKNAMTAGPVAINAGIAVTVPSGCAWTIV